MGVVAVPRERRLEVGQRELDGTVHAALFRGFATRNVREDFLRVNGLLKAENISDGAMLSEELDQLLQLPSPKYSE